MKRTHLVARSQTIKMIHKTFSEESLMNLFMSRGESKPERPGTGKLRTAALFISFIVTVFVRISREFRIK